MSRAGGFTGYAEAEAEAPQAEGMTPDEVQRVLRANKGRRVRVTYVDGVVEAVDVAGVDDEGFVGSGPDGVEPSGYWTRFDSVNHVEPVKS
jgi:hypothetical protein